MFLCRECHKESGCYNIFCDIALSESMGNFYGTCERCKKTAVCTDCHGYDFGKAVGYEKNPIEPTTSVNIK